MRLEDLLHDQDVQRAQTINTTSEAYRKRARELTDTQEQHKKIRTQTLSELSKVAGEVNAHHDLVKRVVADIKRDVFIPESLHNLDLDTKRLIFAQKLPELALELEKPQAFKGLVNFAEQHPDILPINISLIDDPVDQPTAAHLLPLWDRALSQDNPTIQTFMMHKIIKDMENIAQSKDLEPLIKAIYLKPELINLSILEDEDDPAGPTTPTPAMYLAEHNRLTILQKIESNLRAVTQTPLEAEMPDAYNFFKKTDELGNSIIYYALKEGHKDLALWLLHKSKLTLPELEAAAKDGRAPDIKRLLTLPGVNPTEHANAPLMWAIILGHKEVVKELLASNLYDVKAQENIAVITAIRYGYLGDQYLEIAKMLIAKGADIYDQDELALKFINRLNPRLTNLPPTQLAVRQAVCRDFIRAEQSTSQIFRAKEAEQRQKIQQFLHTEKEARSSWQMTEEQERTSILKDKQIADNTITMRKLAQLCSGKMYGTAVANKVTDSVANPTPPPPRPRVNRSLLVDW